MDVIEVAGGRWVARCECGRARVFRGQPEAWEWLLDHPCQPHHEDVTGIDAPEAT